MSYGEEKQTKMEQTSNSYKFVIECTVWARGCYRVRERGQVEP